MYYQFLMLFLLFKFYFHESIETLYDFVPKKYLPTEYGGNSGSFKQMSKQLEKKVLENRDWLLEWEYYGVNENLK